MAYKINASYLQDMTPGVLFIHSNIAGGGGARGVLEKAYNQSLYIKP